MELNIDLEENVEQKIDKFKKIITNGDLNQNIKNKLMIFLLDKTKENLDKEEEIKNKLKEINEKRKDINPQIKNINEEIENQNLYLKKIKSLYFILVNLLMRKNNYGVEKNGDKQITITGKARGNTTITVQSTGLPDVTLNVKTIENIPLGLDLEKAKTSFEGISERGSARISAIRPWRRAGWTRRHSFRHSFFSASCISNFRWPYTNFVHVSPQQFQDYRHHPRRRHWRMF